MKKIHLRWARVSISKASFENEKDHFSPPANSVREDASNDRPQYGSDPKRDPDTAGILCSAFEGNDVANDDLSHRYYGSTSDTLNRSRGNEPPHILGRSAQSGTKNEYGHSEIQKGLPPCEFLVTRVS